MQINDSFRICETAWCPGCGDVQILEALKNALEILKKRPHEVLIAAGIGQAAKTPQYINTNGFCGLHGRALPPAAAAKIANKNLTVIISTGDGDSYGEGGNHFIHNIRRNVDITHFVHNNQIYGLTKGQASPTTDVGHTTAIQPNGTINNPMNPLLLAIALGAGFVARAFSGENEHLTTIMVEAIKYKGYALVDILQPCISFNKVNTFQWYSKRVYKLDSSYNYADKPAAMAKAMEWGDRIPLGILYKENKNTYHDKIDFLKDGLPLVDKVTDKNMVGTFMEEFV
ncbi:MAG: thiamine pyrophosphate-dependent enzyme [Clostridia bacterium]|nr:thiamine pyrophosphate-dependent enzyme [Clostridia bacterium]